jgi:hypothetical protein
MRAPEALSNGAGLQRAPDWDSVHLKNFPPKQHLHERRSGLPERCYNWSCGKSNSPTALTKPRRENRARQTDGSMSP